MRKFLVRFIESMAKHKATLILLLTLSFGFKGYSQTIGAKTNALYWSTTTPNVAIEFATAPKWTIEVGGGYNPWEFSDNKKFKHWMVQSELRYWLCETFEGHFFGFHLQGGEYNIGGIDLPRFVFGRNSGDYRYQGYFIGAGISYGYQWILNDRWSLEATIGFGYNHLEYEKFYSEECGCSLGKFTPSPGYFGPTKAGVSFIYLIK